MVLQEALAALGLGDFGDVLEVEWSSSQRSLPTGQIAFLAPESIRHACRETCVPEQVAEAAAAAGRRIAACEALRSLAWHLHYRLYQSATADWDAMCRWPTLETALQDSAGLFYLIVLLSGLPGMQEVHRAHAVPADVVRDTVRDLRLWLETARGRDVQGLIPVNVAWLANHFRGDLYRLGRLQFQFARFHYRLRVFRRRTPRTVVALSEDGVRYRADGQLSRSAADDEAWTSHLTVTEEEVIGCPILPTGRALRQELRLPLAEWRPVLAPGDPVLNIHIPGGGPLSHDLCGQSFRAALAFFPRHFPERPFVAFCCGSWILNTGLEALLPPSSNLIRFQREVYLFPIGVHLETMMDRVFGSVPEDLTRAPRDTGLRRAILDALQSGRGIETGGGGCFLLPEDLAWGSQVYRRQEFLRGLAQPD